MTLLPKPFVFARHAQSTYNMENRIGGFTDSPLSELGIQQAQQAQPLLNPIDWSIVVTSTLKRTQQTASYAAPNHSFLPYEQLKERNWGDLEGRPVPDHTVYEQTPPNGDSWLDFETRVVTGLNDVLDQYEYPLIIAHSGVYRVLNNLINGSPYCPRIGNVSPILFVPSQHTSGWTISAFKGKLL